MSASRLAIPRQLWAKCAFSMGALSLAVGAAPALARKPPVRIAGSQAQPGTLVTNAGAAGAAYVRTDGKVAYLPDKGSGKRNYVIPPGCQPTAIARRSIGLSCATPTSGSVAVLALDTGVVTPLPYAPPGAVGYRVVGLGTRWAEVVTYGDAAAGHSSTLDVLVNLRTGAATDLADDPFGNRRVIDFNRASPSRALCAKARRTGPGVSGARYKPSMVVGKSFLELYAASGGSRLVSCRTGRSRKIDGSEDLDVANANYVLRRYTVGTGSVSVRRITTGRVWTFARKPSLDVRYEALSSGSLWMAEGSAIYRVSLR